MLIKVNDHDKKVVDWDAFNKTPNINESIIIIDKIPDDAFEYEYLYINGELVRDRVIDFNYKSQETINAEQLATNDAQTITNNEQNEINVDLDYRITMLELGM